MIGCQKISRFRIGRGRRVQRGRRKIRDAGRTRKRTEEVGFSPLPCARWVVIYQRVYADCARPLPPPAQKAGTAPQKVQTTPRCSPLPCARWVTIYLRVDTECARPLSAAAQVLVGFEDGAAEGADDGPPGAAVDRHVADAGGRLHVRHSGAAATSGAHPRHGLRAPHRPPLVHQEAEENHFPQRQIERSEVVTPRGSQRG